MRTLRPTKPTVYGRSQTKQGQALVPAELLKRHLAGTLPDIAKNPEYTHDEHGVQISENLSHMELHELHDLAKRMREEYDKRTAELKEQTSAEYRQQIIDEYKKSHADSLPKPQEPIDPAKPDTAL